MATYSFLSNDFSHPHHRRTVTVLILAIIVFGLLIVAYLYSTDSTPTTVPMSAVTQNDTLTERRALLEVSNAPADLSATELKSRQVLLNKPNTPAKLSEQELEARQTLLTQQ